MVESRNWKGLVNFNKKTKTLHFVGKHTSYLNDDYLAAIFRPSEISFDIGSQNISDL